MTTREGRRSAVGALGFALVVVPRLGLAQQAVRVRRIGVLFRARRFERSPEWSAFVQELAQLGHVEGRTVVFEKRFGDGANLAQLDTLAFELVRLAPVLIFAVGGTDPALAAKRATTKIPIVFYSSVDPVGLGLVGSLARPGGNVTGATILTLDTLPKAMDLLTQATGRFRRIAYLQAVGTRSLSWYPEFVAAVTSAAKALGATAVFVDVDAEEATESLVKRLLQQGVDAVIIGTAPAAADDQAARLRSALFMKHGLRTIGDPDKGFLLSYGEAWQERPRIAAALVDRVLKGAQPADLPVQQPMRFELLINLKTARTLGLTIPQSMLLRADKLIE